MRLGEFKAFSLTSYGQRLAAEWADFATERGRRFARKFGTDRDETEAEARLALVRCIANYTPARGGLEPYLGYKIWADLRDWHRPRTDRKYHRTRRHVSLGDWDVSDGRASAEAAWRGAVAAELIDLAPPRHRSILRARYRDGMTQAAIGAMLGYHHTHISAILRESHRAILAAITPPDPAVAARVAERSRRRPAVVPHPDYPGYGMTADGVAWTFGKRPGPLLIRARKGRADHVNLMIGGKSVRVPYARFRDTHPLHAGSSRAAG